MTFANLKKKSLSASPEVSRPRAVSVEDFIEQAEHYARGLCGVLPFRTEQPVVVPATQDDGPLKQSCAYLSADAKDKLDRLSAVTGISRSRLVRIWLSEVHPERDAPRFIASQVR